MHKTFPAETELPPRFSYILSCSRKGLKISPLTPLAKYGHTFNDKTVVDTDIMKMKPDVADNNIYFKVRQAQKARGPTKTS